ncbi:DUF6807 domain-containing protein [Rubinisphaera brasiliensis]|uniref:Methane oxygenase PmoA n=1 Tax=Rubinisphaera brasiliensis (strain ATCC 49424 / DSM 5305 / JCM 21570 / IAM 15109 / NBRC 103401 / IFAM 1448) TaxID=756272 RepID=F0SNA5_RUBBR|nr:PmoA family protein [Rubinisphaera brasiliensis]ADY62148.1 hypothetical protein Plabr_4577 [Rubinisphaera brasiliensis DSM 5305]
MKVPCRLLVFSLVTALCHVGVHAAEPAPPVKTTTVQIQAGNDSSSDLLVRFPWPDDVKSSSGEQTSWALHGQGGSWPVQRLQGSEGNEAVVQLPQEFYDGNAHTFQLAETSEVASVRPFVVDQDEASVRVMRGESSVFVYHTRPVLPEGIESWYRRSGHIHPLLTPAGQIVSDDFAPDHRHQHGLFFAWVNTSVGDRAVDFWNQAKQQGTVRHAETLVADSGPVTAQLKTRLEHIAFGKEGEQTVLEETWDILLHPAKEINLFEVISVQKNVSKEVVTLNQYHYGGFALRAKRSWLLDSKNGDRSDVVLRTNAETNRKDGNHTPAEWVSIHGPSDFQQGPTMGGAAILGHPENRNAPQPTRLHPQKPYFCFCPVVEAAIELQPGDELRSRYLVATFDDVVDPSRLNELSAAFAQQPRVELGRNGE